MGLKFFGSVVRSFLKKGLIFATLHLSEKEASLMERFKILTIGEQSVFEPCLRNLPARLSILVVLLVLNSFHIFRINTELTFSELSFLMQVFSLVVLAY